MAASRFAVGMRLVVMTILSTGMASGQNFPSKPIRIVSAAVGSSLDLAARLIAPGLTSNLGQPVIVDNRNALIGGEIVSRASPDGYTLLFVGNSFLTQRLMRNNVPFDPVKDFSAITLAVREPNVVVVHPSLAVNSLQELIALAKARPGTLNYATGPSGGSAHLATELFRSMAGINIVRIPYKGNGQGVNGLIGGEVQLMFATAGSVAPYVKSGKLKALAVTTEQPSALFPALPNVSASGLPGYESASTQSIYAPVKTPAAVINRLNQEFTRVLNTPDVKEQFLSRGIEVVASSPLQLAAAMKSEIARMGKVIKDAGIRED